MNIGFNEILIGVLIVLFVVVYSLKIKYMISKNEASKNLETFLKNNYDNKLGYSDLTRFFNSATMNPNSFWARIYQKENPKVELILHFDAKDIITQSDVASDYPDGLSFHKQYLEKIEVVQTQDEIANKIKPLGVNLKWEYNLIYLELTKEYSEAQIFEKVSYFLDLFNAEDFNKLGYYHEATLVLSFVLESKPKLTLPIEQDNEVWLYKDLKLYEDIEEFKTFKSKLEKQFEDYLEINSSTHKLYDYYGSFIAQQNFNQVLFIQFTETKKTRKEIKERKKGVWLSPITGYIVSYLDIEKQQLKYINYVPTLNDVSRDDILDKEKIAFLKSF